MVPAPIGNYPSIHNLYVFHGALPGAEVWTCGLRTAVTVNETDDAMQRQADFAQAAFRACVDTNGGLRGSWPAGVTFLGVTNREISVTGQTLRQAESTGAALVGNSSTGSGPNQNALAISLQTPIAGRHGRGRIYVPYLSALPDVNGLLPAATTAILAASFSKLISQLNGTVPLDTYNGELPPFSPIAIQSRTNGATLAGHVTKVRVGNVVDTIRGRRNKLKETYALSLVA